MTVPSIAPHRTWYEVYTKLPPSQSDNVWEVHDIRYSSKEPPFEFSSMYRMRVTNTLTTFLTSEEIVQIKTDAHQSDDVFNSNWNTIFHRYSNYATSPAMTLLNTMYNKVKDTPFPFLLEVRGIGIADVSPVKFKYNNKSYVEYLDKYLIRTRIYGKTPDGPQWSGYTMFAEENHHALAGYDRGFIADTNRPSMTMDVSDYEEQFVENRPFDLGCMIEDNILRECALFIRKHHFFSSLIGINQ